MAHPGSGDHYGRDEPTYDVRRLEGRLAGLSNPVRVYGSRRHPGEKSPAHMGCADRTGTAKEALQGYARRWSCETANFYLKAQVRLADFQVQPCEAVERSVALVLLARAYGEWRFGRERSARVQTCGDVVRRHREEHAEDWLRGVIRMAIEKKICDWLWMNFYKQRGLE